MNADLNKQQPNRVPSFSNRLAVAQATYFVIIGIWPVVGLRSFERLSGPKVDDWLVKTVGVQVAVVGAALALAAKRQRITPEVELVAMGSALGLAAIDIIYVGRRRIRPVYLADAVLELGFAAGWILSHRGRSSES
jgi:hypothetical protein